MTFGRSVFSRTNPAAVDIFSAPHNLPQTFIEQLSWSLNMVRLNPARIAVAVVLAVSTAALAQATQPSADASPKPDALNVLSGRPDAAGDQLLGGTFHNPLAGIAFRVPGAVQQVGKEGAGDEIARFANEKKTWELIVTKTTTAQPMALSGNEKKFGLLETIAARLKQGNPGIDIVRQDVVNLGENNAGLIAARMTTGGNRQLIQEAIVQANDQLYYSFMLTTPAAKDAKGPDSSDAAEQVAVESFREMLDTIKLLDRSAIKQDQNERLFRTRAFYVNLDLAKLRKTLIPEQWQRLLRDGKDIGYTYIVEEPDQAAGGQEGIKIGIRSRSYPDSATQVDGETWYFVTGDRRHENWSNLVWIQNLPKKTSEQFTEIGSSDRHVERQADNSGQVALGDPSDPKQPPVVVAEPYVLNVQTVGQTGNAEPLKRNLPPFYLPQAVGHLLPRLLPLEAPKTYMFATFVSDRREVMMRYVDVGTEQEVDLAGSRVRAVPITDRIGLQGSATIHYMGPDGKYLGSVNKDSKITILPTDAATLQRLWANKALLTRPTEQPKQ